MNRAQRDRGLVIFLPVPPGQVERVLQRFAATRGRRSKNGDVSEDRAWSVVLGVGIITICAEHGWIYVSHLEASTLMKSLPRSGENFPV